MKANEIQVGGKYIAKVSGKLTTVRVDEIRETTKRGRINKYSGCPSYYKDTVVYDVTNLVTGRRTTFKSAAKFRRDLSKEIVPALTEATEAGFDKAGYGNDSAGVWMA